MKKLRMIQNSILVLVLTATAACSTSSFKINAILEKGKKIYVGSFFNISKKPRIKEKYSHTFPEHGTFFRNGRSMDFQVIINEKGDCYSPAADANESCPPIPFLLVGMKRN